MAAKYIIFKETADQAPAVENGDFVLLEDAEAVKQQLGTALRLSKGDWFLNLDEGLRYVDNERGILGASDLSPENEADIIQIVNNVFGVTQLLSLSTEFITPTEFRISIRVLTEFSRTPIETNITIT